MTRWPRVARCRTGHALLAFLTALGVLLVSQGVGASSALAHNSLVKTVPADGATLEAVPAEIRLVFDQPALKVGPQILITGPQGRVEQVEVQLIDNDVRQAIGPDAPAGRYKVLWRVTSDDGHPVTGDFSFSAKQAGGSAATAPSTAARTQNAVAESSNTGTTDHSGGAAGIVSVLVLLILASFGVWIARRRTGTGKQ